MDRDELFEAVLGSFQDSAITERSYYQDFRRSWERLLRKTMQSDTEYFDISSPACYTVPCRFAGIDVQFHFDQLKLADWYAQEQRRKKRVVFKPIRLKHEHSGALMYHDSPCRYDPKAGEPAISEDERNIIAAALPGLPPELSIVYGSKWVEGRFNAFMNTRLSVFLVETDYVPAFLASPFEVCLYLFMMDYCIIKENHSKVKDEDLKGFLHIFRPSPMLRIKGLI